MKDNNEIQIKGINSKKESFKSRHSLTILLMVVGGFLTFFFLVSGSITDNRFGTHLVFSADLTSSPMWYSLTIMYISIAIILGGFILFSLLYRGKIKLNEGQEKAIRIGSLYLVGSAAFFIALSSITFAVFNSNFYKTLNFEWNSIAPVTKIWGGASQTTNYSTQGFVISLLSVVSIVTIMAATLFAVITKKEFSNRIYYTTRNGAILLIAVGWLVFNINLMAFGAMGGDAEVLLNGVLGTNINFDNVLNQVEGIEIFNTWGNIEDPKEAYMALKDFLDLNFEIDIPKYVIAGRYWDEFWTNGILDIGILGIYIDLPGSIGFNDLILYIYFLSDSAPFWVHELNKPGFFQGVNESAAAIILFSILILSLFVIVGYMLFEYFILKDERNLSEFYDFSIYTIIITTAVYGILAWTSPYILTWGGPENYRPIIDGFIKGEPNGLAPGLIGQAGQYGGISGAIVYYSPLYHGTVLWWTGFIILLITPFASAGYVTYKYFFSSKKSIPRE